MTAITALITRREYMAQNQIAYLSGSSVKSSHHAYYTQFVTERTIAEVTHHFGIDKLVAGLDTEPGISLTRWDAFCWSHTSLNITPLAARSGGFHANFTVNREALREAGETVTRATLVCIAKAAARVAVERTA